MDNIAIDVNNITKIYKLYNKPSDRLKESFGFKRKILHKEHFALNNISFSIKKGETIGIIGANGSGKSTLLKMITGVLTPTKGEILVDGRISALLELGAGFNMEYTGIQNIYLNGSMLGFSDKEIENRVLSIVEFADIGEFINQPVKTYSSGMFVRLAFAVAINIDPEILIVDEALSVGDVFFQAKCYKKFEEFKENGKTILFVSHDLGSITKYCDRVILLNNGEFVGEGSPKAIINVYKKILVNQYSKEHLNINAKKIELEEKCWKTQLSINPYKEEYGDRNAEIVDFAIRDSYNRLTNIIDKNEEFTITFKVKFNRKVENPIYAFTIKDIRGNEVTGTNTLIEQVYVGLAYCGDMKIVEFRQNMNLQGGQYLLSLGCTGFENGYFTVYHRLYDVCNIQVESTKNTIGFYDMNTIITIE